MVVQPDTVIRWHRDWLRRRWTRRSHQRHDGRPQIDPQIRALVREMATANLLWGAPRIHGELRTLGVQVSERTVSRLLEPHTRPSPQTWKTSLTNHLTSAASMDFFTVPTLTGRVLFVLVVLSHVRRRIVYFNITDHPTAEWTTQQVVDAFPDDTAPKWLHRDRDSVYGEIFRRRVAGTGIAEGGLSPGESVAESVRGTRDRQGRVRRDLGAAPTPALRAATSTCRTPMTNSHLFWRTTRADFASSKPGERPRMPRDRDWEAQLTRR